jgi:hypothetical protein
VKCFARNMDDEARHVIEGDSESGYENEFILLTEMQGSFHAYPESDAGFPASYAEIRDRLMELLGNLKKNPFLMAFLDDPDNVQTIARYTLPPNIKVPGNDERTKIKRILSQLAKMDAMEVPDPMNPGQMTYIPTFFPDRDFDDMEMIVKLAKAWGQKHWQLAYTDPLKFENVRAYLRSSSRSTSYSCCRSSSSACNARSAGNTSRSREWADTAQRGRRQRRIPAAGDEDEVGGCGSSSCRSREARSGSPGSWRHAGSRRRGSQTCCRSQAARCGRRRTS